MQSLTTKCVARVLLSLGLMLLLSGCPREGRYIVHNAAPSSIHVATSEGPVAIRSQGVATIMQYDRFFEISKDGRALFKFSTLGGTECRKLDLSSYRFDQDAYFGLGQYSTVTLVVLPTRQVFVVPYTVDPMTEVRSGAILARPRLPECPASSKSKKLRKPEVAPSAMVNFSEFIEIADRYAVEELQLKQGEYACKPSQHVDLIEGRNNILRETTIKFGSKVRENSMKSECRSWMSIERYRDFYDVPRLMLTSDDGGEYWIFDCPFDDVEGKYPSIYRVFSVGKNFQEAIGRFHSSGEWDKVSPVAEIEVQTLLFDDTRREKFRWPGIQALLGH